MSRVLMVDDDTSLLEDNRRFFEAAGYEVFCAKSVEEAKMVLAVAPPDGIILDVDLPGQDGFALCADLRKTSCLPIVFLSGYTEAESRIRGLEIGGDDYVCKPYSLPELELRVRARIRTAAQGRPTAPLAFDQLTIDAAARRVFWAGQEVVLSTFEFDILYLLASHPGQVFGYEQIYEQVWQSTLNKGIKSLQMLIVRIRQKLNALCPDHEYIQTIRRKGYFFVP